MEQITIIINNMADVRREIDHCQRRAMTSVVELGYILRKADDAGLYREQGYASIFRFAEAEYGWSQSQTSRFMNINREFSEGGYSTILKEKYKGFGQAKLAEMLTLPEAIREELSPDMKRNEIREVKEQYREAEQEEKENLFEAAVFSGGQGGAEQAAVEKLFSLPDMAKKLTGLYPYMQKAAEGSPVREEEVRMVISSTGFGTVRAGGMMFFWKKDGVSTIKGQQKGAFSYRELLEMLNRIRKPQELTPEEWYRKVYGKEIPGIKPDQPEKEPDRAEEASDPQEDRKEKKAEKKTEGKQPSHIETSTNSGESEEGKEPELEGQTEIAEFADKMPVGADKEETDQPEPGKTEREQSGAKPPSHIETSTNGEGSGTGQQDGGCGCCTGKKVILSNDGEFEITLNPNGLARIEHGVLSAVMEFIYCPICGKELAGDES